MIAQDKKEREIRARKMTLILQSLFPNAAIALNYSNNIELLFAVILSAQCTDKRVNEVTKILFKKYKTLDDYLGVRQRDFEKDIHSCGFFRNKAKNILGSAKMLKKEFNGEIPRTMKEALLLPGVARKTANVVLSNAYGINEGIAVDTHVRRFSIRFNLSDYTDPVRIEKDLMEVLSKDSWALFNHQLVLYGREVCPARKHDCVDHQLTNIYPQSKDIWPSSQ